MAPRYLDITGETNAIVADSTSKAWRWLVCGRVGGIRRASSRPAIAPSGDERRCPNSRRAVAHRGDANGHPRVIVANSHRLAAIRLRCRPGLRPVLCATTARPGGACAHAANTRHLQCNDFAHLRGAGAVPDAASATNRHNGSDRCTRRTALAFMFAGERPRDLRGADVNAALVLTATTIVSAIGRGCAATLEALRSRRSGCVRAISLMCGTDISAASMKRRRTRCRPRFSASTAATIVWPTWRCGRMVSLMPSLRHAGRYGADRIAVVLGTSTSGMLSSEEAYRARDAMTGHTARRVRLHATRTICSRWRISSAAHSSSARPGNGRLNRLRLQCADLHRCLPSDRERGCAMRRSWAAPTVFAA